MPGNHFLFLYGFILVCAVLIHLLYYLAATVLLSGVDAIRIKQSWDKVKNINHWVSYGLAVVLMGVLYFIIRPTGWHILIEAVSFIAIRGMTYDIMLNIFRRERLVDYNSDVSNSLNDARLTHITFWQRRALYAVLLAICLLLNHWV